MEQDIAAQVVGLGGATDFSLWKLFLRADFVVKFVIILLIAASIFSWALIFDKFKLLAAKYILPSKMNILVVGDAKTQLGRLKELGYGDPILLNKH